MSPETDHRDAALLRLQTRFMAERATLASLAGPNGSGDDVAAAYDRAASLVDDMLEIRARTFEGVRVKFGAFWWCRGIADLGISDPVDGRFDREILTSIERDFAAMDDG